MTDLPVSWQENISRIDFAALKDKVADYSSVFSVIRETWSRETIKELSDGKVFVPDAVINEAVKKRIAAETNAPVTEIALTSHENGLLDIEAVTPKGDKLLLSGTIETFSQKDGKALLSYRVKKHKLPGHGLSSWIFSRVSLSMAEKLFGKIKTDDTMPVAIKKNTVTIDFSDALAMSKLSSTTFAGERLIDIVEIEGAVPKEGGIELDTKLNVSDEMKAALKRIASEKF